MPTVNAHDAIVSAIVAALQSAPAVTTGTIGEDIDTAALPEEVAERVNVTLEGSEPQRAATLSNPINWMSDVAVDCTARADGTVSGQRASRALHAKVYSRLMANRSLGGLAIHIEEPTIRGDATFSDTRIGTTTGVYRVMHRTAAGTLDVTT